MTLDDAPHCGIVNGVVTVNNAVAKADDTRQFIDALNKRDIDGMIATFAPEATSRG